VPVLFCSGRSNRLLKELAMGQKSAISPIIFIASILCFLFPFLTISCGGQKVGHFTGVQLATGTTVEQPQMFGPPQKKEVDPDPLTALAGLCALVGLGMSFIGARLAIAPAIAGAAGAVCLLLMKSRMDDQVLAKGQGMLQVNYEIGYSLALILLFAGAVWNALLFSQRTPGPAVAVIAPPPGQHTVAEPTSVPFNQPPLTVSSEQITSGSRFCQACGIETVAGSRFCMNCGKSVGAITQTG
jgi:hypothetical protein